MMHRTIKRRIVPKNCLYCKNKTEPDYKDIEALRKYISERGRILGKDVTGVCAKHQRRVAQSIRRARQVALLPFVGGL